MKKILVLIIVATIVVLIFIGCNKNNSKSKLDTFEIIKKNKLITMGLNATYPPMEFKNKNNELVGFDVDLGKEIGKKLGISTKIITNDWKGIILALNSKKFDMILSGMSITCERENEINFSKSYIVGGQRIIINDNRNKIKNLQDLEGKAIGCQMGTTGQVAATKINGLKDIKKYDAITQALNDLSIGRIDAVIADAQVGKYYLNKHDKGLKMIDVKVTNEPIGIGFRKEDSKLRDEVQKILDELYKDGTMSKLSKKWFGEDIYIN